MNKINIRNKLKDIYYKYIFYDFPIVWKKDYISCSFGGWLFKMNYFVDNTLGYYDSKYYNDISCFKKDLFGYLRYYKIKDRDIVIDCGAFEGAFTVFASKSVGDEGKVISFEPNKKAFERLKLNVELNELKNVILINKGLWNCNKVVKFNDNLDTSIISKDGNSEIDVTTLDNELKRLNIDKVDFIKMDIEGAEIEAIEGAKDILKKSNVNLGIASYHLVNGKKTYITIEKQLKNLGYEVKTSFPKHLTTYAKKSKFESINATTSG